MHVPARADKPCSGGDSEVARPIAAVLQPKASAVDPKGRFEVKVQGNRDLTTNVYLRHMVGSNAVFVVVAKLPAYLAAAAVRGLPASEGFGISLLVEDGGAGLRNFCTVLTVSGSRMAMFTIARWQQKPQVAKAAFLPGMPRLGSPC